MSGRFADEHASNATAEAMRIEFDGSFARPHHERAAVEAFLTIVVGPDPHAIRLEEVAGLFVDRRITPVPSVMPGLLGLVGLRNVVAPVYDLRALLGYPPLGGRENEARFLVSARANASIAFAFDAFEAHVRVEADAVATSTEGRSNAHIEGTLTLASGPRPIIRLASIVEDLSRRAIRDNQKET